MIVIGIIFINVNIIIIIIIIIIITINRICGDNFFNNNYCLPVGTTINFDSNYDLSSSSSSLITNLHSYTSKNNTNNSIELTKLFDIHKTLTQAEIDDRKYIQTLIENEKKRRKESELVLKETEMRLKQFKKTEVDSDFNIYSNKIGSYLQQKEMIFAKGKEEEKEALDMYDDAKRSSDRLLNLSKSLETTIEAATQQLELLSKINTLRLELEQYNIRSSAERLRIYESMNTYINGVKEELLEGRFKIEIPQMITALAKEFKRDMNGKVEVNAALGSSEVYFPLYCTMRVGLETIRVWKQLSYKNDYSALSDQINALEAYLNQVCSLIPKPSFTKNPEDADIFDKSNSTIVLFFDHLAHDTPLTHVENQSRVDTCLEFLRKQVDDDYDNNKFRELNLINCKDIVSPPLWTLPIVHSPQYLR